MTQRVMALTAELAALCHREVADPGPTPGAKYLSEDEFRPAAERIVASRPAGPFLLFAYGSLIWKPEVAHVASSRARAIGWHRAFSMKIMRYRGTIEQPGYMMCLDPGGTCDGVILQLPESDLVGQVEKLLRREISRPGGLEAIRWIEVNTHNGTEKALAFYAAPRQLENYAMNRPPEEVAYGLARACGHWGSGAEYLYNTVSHLEDLGIHDEVLWHLQELVACEIRKLCLQRNT